MSAAAAEAEVLESLEDGVATLTLNRPERLNAMSDSMLETLGDSLRRLTLDPAVGAIVLTGTGRSFCVGGDVKTMGSADSTWLAEDILTRNQRKAEIPILLREGQKPTIAMLRGHAVGAGLSLALACDFRFSSETTVLKTAFTQVSMSGDFGCSYLLTHMVGQAKARELLMLSRPVKAQEALALGLLTEVVPDEELHDTTMAAARELARGPKIAFHYMKRNLNAAVGSSFAEIVRLESYAQVRCRATRDHKEGIAALAEKRAPIFTGQ